jgi:hypothetical protein
MISIGLMKKLRFSSLINGVFIGVGIAFFLWGTTDIAFPIAERMSVAVFGLMKIILGIVSLSVGVGVESVQWAKIGSNLSLIDLYEQMPPEEPKLQAEQSIQPVQPSQPIEQQEQKTVEKPQETPPTSAPATA